MAGDRPRLARRVLWEGSVGSFGIDEVELPNGRHATLALLHHPGAAAVVPFLDAERILLLRQYRHAAGGTIWEVPAGKIDAGEDPEQCALREALTREYTAGQASSGTLSRNTESFRLHATEIGTLPHVRAISPKRV